MAVSRQKLLIEEAADLHPKIMVSHLIHRSAGSDSLHDRLFRYYVVVNVERRPNDLSWFDKSTYGRVISIGHIGQCVIIKNVLRLIIFCRLNTSLYLTISAVVEFKVIFS